MKRLVIILLFASVCIGDTLTSHQKPNTDSFLDIGTATLYWRFIYGDAFTDGTAYWESSQLYGFDEIDADSIVALVDLYGEIITGNEIHGTTIFGVFIEGDLITGGVIRGDTLTDGTFTVSGGIVTAGTWQATVIDISDYTNLIAGTNITLVDDTLNVDDAFLINDGDDTTTGIITSNGFTTTGTNTTDILIVGSNAPATTTSTGTTGTITWDSNYLYVCIANNSWKRVALSTWIFVSENVIFAGENVIFAGEQVVYP